MRQYDFGKNYTIFNHISDLGIEVTGSDLFSLFENSGVALFDLITNLNQVEVREYRHIFLKGDDIDLLLRDWLGELLYLSIVDEFLFKSFDIEGISDFSLKAKAWGEKFDPERHIIKREIKSVTYHQLKVTCNKGKWRARFVLDI